MRYWSQVISLLIVSNIALAQSPDSLLLKDYHPLSIYKIPSTRINSASYQTIDMHSHPYATTLEELEGWVQVMDQFNIRKTVILTFATGSEFDSLAEVYGKYKNRFDLWCGIDYTGYNEEGWSAKAVKELERCHAKGAKGIGELGDKGIGLIYSHPTQAKGMHINDPRLEPVLKRCGELNMPINIHVAEPIWMYEKMDNTNDGLINGHKWCVDHSQPGLIGHQELINTLESAVKNNPNTTFIACHFANCSYDLSILSRMLDKYSNLYADVSARFGETGTIPRYMKQFYQDHQDRLLFGTDMGMAPEMYEVVFRILETEDEHFYRQDYFNYHWPLHGFGLSNKVLKKLYYKNARKALQN